jgi:CDP-diglyceride synthetase
VAHRVALAILSVCSFLTLICCFVDHPFAAALFGFAGLGFIPALIALGAARRGKLKSLAAPLVILSLILAGCFAAMLALPGRVGTAIMLVGLWLVPLLLVSFLYAWDFHRFGLRSDDLERIREIARKAAGR